MKKVVRKVTPLDHPVSLLRGQEDPDQGEVMKGPALM